MSAGTSTWTMFSSHGIIFFQIAANSQSTLRELSDVLCITERQVGRTVKDLAEAGTLTIERRGRRNRYKVNPDAYLRHPTLSHIPLARIISAVVPEMTRRTIG